MNGLQTLPAWAALLAGAAVLAGALLACIGATGLLRLDSFYRRVHAPTLGTTLGLYLILAGALVYFWASQDGPPWRVILIGVCLSLSAPISLTLLARAAFERDRRNGALGVPAADSAEAAHSNDAARS